MKNVLIWSVLCLFIMASVAYAADDEQTDTLVSPQLIAEPGVIQPEVETIDVAKLIESEAYLLVDDGQHFSDREWPHGKPDAIGGKSTMKSVYPGTFKRGIANPKAVKSPSAPVSP